MKTDKSQDKYQKVCRDLREEKMNWSFEEFLETAEKEEPETTVKSTFNPRKFYWVAASLVFLLASVAVLKNFGKNDMAEQDILVKNEILKQRPEFNQDNEIFAVHTVDSLKIASDSLVSDSTRVSLDEDDVDQILPTRGRMRKQMRPQFAHTENLETSKQPVKAAQEYKANYVIINGQRIENEQEAIDLTKYSFRILSENVTKTVAKTDAIPSFNNDY